MRWWKVALALLAMVAGYVLYLDTAIQRQFEGKRWELPAHVYARPLELFTGKTLTSAALADELAGADYRFVPEPRYPGEVARDGNTFIIFIRLFTFADGSREAAEIRVEINDGRVATLFDISAGQPIQLVQLEPELIGILYPARREDRVLVRLQDVPPLLTDLLLATEDRHFYTHHGIALRAVARAMLANLRAGRYVQGGSTLTQQLVKNFFLSNERTLARKINEAIMALLLEAHYTKNEILEAYLNEVYLGQEGRRAIHGFGLAGQFYFGRELTELTDDQLALLVALVKGASWYDPRRHPARARQRRNQVLETAELRSVLDAARVRHARQQPLGVIDKPAGRSNRYPAFLDLVRRQLAQDYREEDLTSEGLRIFTTLDPHLQRRLEQTFADRLPSIESAYGIEAGMLQGAGIVTRNESAEVLAMVAGREPGAAGFNRVLDSARPVGSIIKPAVYLTALQDPERFTLATLIDDSPLTVESPYGEDWSPRNYDQAFHGPVPLFRALGDSLNVATVRLGIDVGIDRVVATLERLGIERHVPPWPSLLLGAVELAPIEVAALYQTLAGGGFRTPLRAIRSVVAADGRPLQRYPVAVERALDPEPVYLVNRALQLAVRDGTGRGLSRILPAGLHVAGKTGTTDDLRDSWFAGFAGNRLAVIWLGRDDNRPVHLTGAAGAMEIWGRFMADSSTEPLQLAASSAIELHWIDAVSGRPGSARCEESVQLPFIAGSAPRGPVYCAGRKGDRWRQWFHGKP